MVSRQETLLGLLSLRRRKQTCSYQIGETSAGHAGRGDLVTLAQTPPGADLLNIAQQSCVSRTASSCGDDPIR